MSCRKCNQCHIVVFKATREYHLHSHSLEKSYEIFGLNVVLESIGTEAVWSCHIFFIGSDSEIVAITEGTRSAIVIIMIIYIVTSCSHPA